MAGLHAEALARRRPELVAGLVLVDGSVEWKPKRPFGEAAWQSTAERATQGRCALPPVRIRAGWAGRVLMGIQTETALSRATDRRSQERRTVTRSRSRPLVAEQAAYATSG